eukprot:1415701-Amphidinium_carterae.2
MHASSTSIVPDRRLLTCYSGWPTRPRQGRSSLTLQTKASANSSLRPRLEGLCLTQQAGTLASWISRPRQGVLRITL